MQLCWMGTTLSCALCSAFSDLVCTAAGSASWLDNLQHLVSSEHSCIQVCNPLSATWCMLCTNVWTYAMPCRRLESTCFQVKALKHAKLCNVMQCTVTAERGDADMADWCLGLNRMLRRVRSVSGADTTGVLQVGASSNIGQD